MYLFFAELRGKGKRYIILSITLFEELKRLNFYFGSLSALILEKITVKYNEKLERKGNILFRRLLESIGFLPRLLLLFVAKPRFDNVEGAFVNLL